MERDLACCGFISARAEPLCYREVEGEGAKAEESAPVLDPGMEVSR